MNCTRIFTLQFHEEIITPFFEPKKFDASDIDVSFLKRSCLLCKSPFEDSLFIQLSQDEALHTRCFSALKSKEIKGRCSITKVCFLGQWILFPKKTEALASWLKNGHELFNSHLLSLLEKFQASGFEEILIKEKKSLAKLGVLLQPFLQTCLLVYAGFFKPEEIKINDFIAHFGSFSDKDIKKFARLMNSDVNLEPLVTALNNDDHFPTRAISAIFSEANNNELKIDEEGTRALIHFLCSLFKAANMSSSFKTFFSELDAIFIEKQISLLSKREGNASIYSYLNCLDVESLTRLKTLFPQKHEFHQEITDKANQILTKREKIKAAVTLVQILSVVLIIIKLTTFFFDEEKVV